MTVKRQMDTAVDASAMTAARAIEDSAMRPLRRLRKRLVVAIVVLGLLLVYMGIGTMMSYGLLPHYDLGYEWLRGIV